jgi:glucokinase
MVIGMAMDELKFPTSVLLGIDIGGTKLAAIIGDEDGRVIERADAPTPRSADSDWRMGALALVELAREVCVRTGVSPKNVAAIGVSCGGPLDPEKGIILNPPNLPGWRDVPLREFLAMRLENANIALENDANATALAEHRWGAGRGASNLAYLTFGTGMGAGLILNGALYQGKRDLAGEIGHAVIDPNGPRCLCGKRGCLEALASGGALDRVAAEHFGEGATASTICDYARRGDSDCVRFIDSAARALGIGIANLLHTLDLEVVILGSLALKAGDLFLEPVRSYAREFTWPSIFEGVQIVPAGLGSEAQDKAALAIASNVVRELRCSAG